MYSLVPFLLAAAFGARADTLPSPWRLTDLLAAVEARSPELSAARGEQLAAEARIGPVSRLPDPRLQVGLMNRSLPSLGRRSVLAMDQIQLVQTIPVPGRLRAEAGVARAGARAAAAGVDERRLAVRLGAADDFLEIDRVDRSVAALEQTGSLLREIEGVARAMYSVGTGSQSDVLRAQVELAKLEEELTGMTAMRAGAVARLNALLVRPAGLTIGAVISPALPDSLPPVATLLDAALQGGPALQAARARLDGAEAGRRVARLARWPDFELGVVYAQQPMADRTGTERMASFMVGATIPIWAGSRQGAMRREAAAMAQSAGASVRVAEADVQGRIGELVAEFDRARRLRALYRGTILPEARAGTAASLAAYRTGKVTLDRVLEGYLTIVEYQMEEIRLDRDQARAVIGLEAITTLPLMQPTPGGSR